MVDFLTQPWVNAFVKIEENVNYYCTKVRRKCLPCLQSCLFLLILFWDSVIILMSCRLPCYSIIFIRTPIYMWHSPVHCWSKIQFEKINLTCLTCFLMYSTAQKYRKLTCSLEMPITLRTMQFSSHTTRFLYCRTQFL